MTISAPPSNFAFLQVHDEQLVRLGLLAEQYFAADPDTCLIKLRQYGEVLAQRLAVKAGYVADGRAAVHVVHDEAENCKLLDGHLRQADSATLHYSACTQPQKGHNFAIAEWLTMNRPADYVLFVRSVPLAVVEAKRQFHDVSAKIQQAKRVSRSFNNFGGGEAPSAPCSNGNGAATFRIPFVFSTNRRPLDHLSRRRTG